MAHLTSLAELRKMQVKDLRREVREQRTLVAKLRMTVRMEKEKDSAKYKREKRQLSRMLTVMTSNQADEATNASKSSETSTSTSKK